MSISKLVRQLLILSSLLAGGRLLAADAVKHTWSFDDDTVGQIAQGFTAEVGKWAVTDTDQGKILRRRQRTQTRLSTSRSLPERRTSTSIRASG